MIEEVSKGIKRSKFFLRRDGLQAGESHAMKIFMIYTLHKILA
jgi:hypothetical protein